jgi:thioredoxin 1
MAQIQVTKANFEERVLQSEKPVLLDFWAPWCGPCKLIAPIVEEIAEQNDSIVLGKVNVDEEMDLAVRFGIASIPTLVVIKNGEAAGKLIGYRPKEDILKLLGL